MPTGVLAAEDKAGKTGARATQRAIVRRLRAICIHKELAVEELAARLRLCFRVPASPAAPAWRRSPASGPPARRRL